MNSQQKRGRYQRIHKQLAELFIPVRDPIARMATMAALLHHKFDYYFWTGFYILKEGELYVGPYQDSLACMKLRKNTGVCWTGVQKGETVIVDNVHDFPGHIACDSRSNSEIVVPLRHSNNEITGVLDVDSKSLSSFDKADAKGLELLVKMIYTESIPA